MPITRRTVIKAALGTAIGSAAGGALYGIGYERHQIGTTESELPIAGLPDALDGLRIGFVTDVHHSLLVPEHDVMRAVDLTLADLGLAPGPETSDLDSGPGARIRQQRHDPYYSGLPHAIRVAGSCR